MTSHGLSVCIFLGGEITPIDGTPCFRPSLGVHWNPSRDVIVGNDIQVVDSVGVEMKVFRSRIDYMLVRASTVQCGLSL